MEIRVFTALLKIDFCSFAHCSAGLALGALWAGQNLLQVPLSPCLLAPNSGIISPASVSNSIRVGR